MSLTMMMMMMETELISKRLVFNSTFMWLITCTSSVIRLDGLCTEYNVPEIDINIKARRVSVIIFFTLFITLDISLKYVNV
jgi:hypothetical protein